MFDQIVRRAFSALFSELNDIRQSLSVLEAGMRRIENLEPKRDRSVYVTLRGFFVFADGREVPHAWTQRAEIDSGDGCQVPFTPYHKFRTERVDILGPATITGVNIGNMSQVESNFEHPAMLEFAEMVEVGNKVTVYLKGSF